MVFKKRDLFDIYCNRRDKAINEGTNKSLAIALFHIQWESYTQALVDFGIVDNKTRGELLKLPLEFP